MYLIIQPKHMGSLSLEDACYVHIYISADWGSLGLGMSVKLKVEMKHTGVRKDAHEPQSFTSACGRNQAGSSIHAHTPS